MIVKTVLNNLSTHIGYEDDRRLVHTDKRTGTQFVSIRTWTRGRSWPKVQQNRMGRIEGTAVGSLGAKQRHSGILAFTGPQSTKW
jgi:hypothetical protein